MNTKTKIQGHNVIVDLDEDQVYVYVGPLAVVIENGAGNNKVDVVLLDYSNPEYVQTLDTIDVTLPSGARSNRSRRKR